MLLASLGTPLCWHLVAGVYVQPSQGASVRRRAAFGALGEERRHQAPGSRACIHALTRQRLDDAYVTDTARVLAADSLLTFLGLRLLPNIVYRAGSYTFV